MPWEEKKENFGTSPRVEGRKKLTAAEWNDHVNEGHFPPNRLQFGMNSGDPVIIDPENDDEIIARYDKVNNAWEFDKIAVGEIVEKLNTTLTIDGKAIDDLGSSNKTLAPYGVEIDNNSAVEMGVPVPDGQTITVESWGVRTSEDTTPAGLAVQLTDGAGAVVGEESTSYNGAPSVSDTNNTGGVVWYKFRIENTTGTDIIVGNTPDAVFGEIEYTVN